MGGRYREKTGSSGTKEVCKLKTREKPAWEFTSATTCGTYPILLTDGHKKPAPQQSLSESTEVVSAGAISSQ